MVRCLMRGQLSLACTFEDEGLSGENITAEKLDLAAAEQSEVLVVSRKIRAFNPFTCSQSYHIKTSVHPRVMQKILE